jgi:hypothetical protein
MAKTRASTGILVGRDLISVFRDTFTDYSEDSIHPVGSIPTDRFPELHSFTAGLNRDPAAFEVAVRLWLDGLRYRFLKGFTSGADADTLLAEHILPVLLMGEIRSTGPRSPVRAAG